ncbi:MAG TPA: protein translocase subunit SecF, partial [Nitrospirae bacterium]|nr:protein translocase subunit SecF [Nitrospirota bacterium]
MIELIRKRTKIDFMGKRFYALSFSAILIVMGLFTIIQVARGTANLGIDFAGGTAVQIKFSEYVPLEDIRDALTGNGLTDFALQDFPNVNKVLIKTKKGGEALGILSKKIISVLSQKFPDKNLVIDSTTEIGPKVGKRLRKDAMWAILASIAGILIYLGWRFQFRFGVGATFATFHDVLAILGIFYLLDKEINLILVSALLMIAGYSLTDTVVVFDRIRENLRAMHKKPIIE